MRSTYAFHRPVVNAYLVRERDRRRGRELLWVLGLVLPLALGLLANIWIHQELVRTGYRIHELQGRLEELRREERLLRVEAAALLRPQLVHRRAVDELGMQEPAPRNIVYVEELE